LEVSGRRQRRIADEVVKQRKENHMVLRGSHRLPVTCVTLSNDETTAFTASKDGSIVKCMTSSLDTDSLLAVESNISLWHQRGRIKWKKRGDCGIRERKGQEIFYTGYIDGE